MTTIQSPSHALGLMVMGAYNRLFEVMPKCVVSQDGPKEILPVILAIDAMLCSYHDTMIYREINDEGVDQEIKYNKKIVQLRKKRKMLRLNNSADNQEWMELFYEYLTLLSSCFNAIALAPAKEMKEDDDDESPYLPDEPQEDIPQTNENLSNENMEESTPA